MFVPFRLPAAWRGTLAVSCAAIGMTIITFPVMVMFLVVLAAWYGTLAVSDIAA